jgi:NADPH:quinone reductase-like Zn-dependent oxidoreductase
VLIQGASGGVGTFAVQFAKALGGEVTAVCSTSKVEQARSLGADHVIDYKKDDFVQSGKQYDLILGVNGHRRLSEYKRALKPEGTYIMVGGTNAAIFEALLLGPLYAMTGKQTFGQLTFNANQKGLTHVKEMIEAGKIKPVIDHRYP